MRNLRHRVSCCRHVPGVNAEVGTGGSSPVCGEFFFRNGPLHVTVMVDYDVTWYWRKVWWWFFRVE